MGPRLLFGALSSALLVVSCGKTDIAPAIEWNDLATGERKARRTGKPAVIFVFATWSTADVELDPRLQCNMSPHLGPGKNRRARPRLQARLL